MPIYEYRCRSCHRRVAVFLRLFPSSFGPSCPRCGSRDLDRLPSTFAVKRSEESVYEDILSDSTLVKGLEENDPRALAEWSRRTGLGEEPEELETEFHETEGED